ncbi:MAG TPA: DUF4339 domain-containing protein [Verrucomicrobiae bacterium]
MEPQREEYFLLVNGETAGPYTLAELHEMWMSDKITLDTLFVRPGMKKCQPINLILGMVINYQTATAKPAPTEIAIEEESALAPLKGVFRWGITVAIMCVFIWVIGPWRYRGEEQTQVMRAIIEVKPADIRIINESDFEWNQMFVYLNGTPPSGFKRLLGNLKPGQQKDLILLEFNDSGGAPFEPWRMTVSDVWIGNEKNGYRTFRIRQPLPVQP